MGKKDVYYSYDVDTGEIVGKTRFNDDDSIDTWSGINATGYSHKKYSNPSSFAQGGIGDVYNREVGEDCEKSWIDRDGVMDKK
ncbi:hypothetical protein [Faecalicoccus pleomorphus]|uniref:hypothetical protein n=1 Tax=Faecalicoccus pleomorphus TaxID=1323 RepID=UPI0039F5B4D1